MNLSKVDLNLFIVFDAIYTEANLTRMLMPLRRYPVGDRACWREPSGTL